MTVLWIDKINTDANIYNTFSRPVFEYTSEILDACSVADSKNLENVQLEAANIITGLPLFAFRNVLYSETVLETLIKILNDMTPDFLVSNVPPKIEECVRLQT